MLFYRKYNLLAIIFLSSALQAQTAHEMSKEVENLYRKGAATSISFSLDGEKTSLNFAAGTTKFRIEDPNDLIVSDGVTIWHFTKQKKEVVIDKIGAKGSSLSSADELIKFSSNYSSVLSRKGKLYELQLTPTATISKLMESVGGISQLVFSLKKSPAGIEIKNITAKTAKKNFTIKGIKIKSVSKFDDSLFTFTAPKGTKVVDLRE